MNKILFAYNNNQRKQQLNETILIFITTDVTNHTTSLFLGNSQLVGQHVREELESVQHTGRLQYIKMLSWRP